MVSVTSHAKRRLKERCGVSKNSAMNMAERTFNKGISFENASTDLKKYISSVYIRHEKTGDNIRIYGNMVYVFDNRTLITVYPIPGDLLNKMERKLMMQRTKHIRSTLHRKIHVQRTEKLSVNLTLLL